jgi:hypothetical protein
MESTSKRYTKANMCKKLKYYLCYECELIEIQLDPCEVQDLDHVICDDCFDAKAIRDNDTLSMMITKTFNELKKTNPDIKSPKQRIRKYK